MNPYLIFVLAVLLVGYAVERIASVLNARHASPQVPPEFEGLYDPERYRRSQQYLRANTRFGTLVDTVSNAVVVGFILLGGFELVDSFARSPGWAPIPTGLVFAAALALGADLLGLPFSIWRTFVIEQRFGFNRTGKKTFLLDHLKGWVLGGVLGGVLGALVLWLFEAAGEWAWVWCWGVLTVVGAFIAFISPVVIMPLFNKFQPLSEGELRAAIEALACQEDFAKRGIFTCDASRRSSKSNAFFTGFGKTRRIVLYDTLIQKHPTEEIVAILAHEIGHYRKKHIPKQLLASFLTAGLTLYLLSLFVNHRGLFDAFGMTHLSIYGSLVFFGFLYSPITTVLGLFGHRLSRRFEREADDFAARAAGAGPFIAALKRLAIENLSNLTPHPFYIFLHYSHPPVLARIRRLHAGTS